MENQAKLIAIPPMDNKNSQEMSVFFVKLKDLLVEMQQNIDPISSDLDPTNNNSAVSYILSMMAMLHLRICDLEMFKQIDHGSVDFTEDNKDNNYYGGIAYGNITSLSAANRRIVNLERKVAYLQSTTAETIATMIEALNTNAESIGSIEGLNTQVMISINNKSVAIKALEPRANGGDDKLVSSYIDYARKATNMLGRGGELLSLMFGQPELVEGIETAMQVLNGVYTAIDVAYSAYEYLQAVTSGEQTLSFSTMINILTGDAAKRKPLLNQSSLASTMTMVSTLFAVSNAHDSLEEGIFQYNATMEIHFKPMNGGVTGFLGKNVVKWSDKHPELDIKSWANRLPVHAFIIVNIQTSPTTRIQFVASTGGFDVTLALITNKLTENYFAYLKRSMILSNGKWVQDKLMFTSQDINIDSMYENINKSTLHKIYDVPPNEQNFTCFFDNMIKYDSRYSLLHHNCQHASNEIVDFFVNNRLPHWWTPDISVSCLVDILKHGEVVAMGNEVFGSAKHNKHSVKTIINNQPQTAPLNGRNKRILRRHKYNFLTGKAVPILPALDFWNDKMNNDLPDWIALLEA